MCIRASAAALAIRLLPLGSAAVARGLAALLRGTCGRLRAIAVARRGIGRHSAGCENKATKGGKEKKTFHRGRTLPGKTNHPITIRVIHDDL